MMNFEMFIDYLINKLKFIKESSYGDFDFYYFKCKKKYNGIQVKIIFRNIFLFSFIAKLKELPVKTPNSK